MQMMNDSDMKRKKHDHVEKKDALALQESRAVYASKSLVLIVLTAVAIFGGLMYIYSKRDEDEKFRNQFANHALRVLEAFEGNTRQTFGAIENLALAITSHTKFAQATFPFVTLPDWEVRCASTRKLAGVMSVWMIPVVEGKDRSKWELYSVENQGWLSEGLEVQRQNNGNTRSSSPISLQPIPSSIYRVDGLSPAPESGSGPYYPVWQVAPAIPLSSVINFNLISHPGFKDAMNVLIETKKPVIGRSFDYSDPNDEQSAGRRDLFNLILRSIEDGGAHYKDDPVSDLYYPVYATLQKGSESKLVGFLTSLIYWRTHFTAILPENVGSIIVVLENTCNQTYTYQINGQDVEYIGPGDRHDTTYDNLEVSRGFDAFLETPSNNKNESVHNSTTSSAEGNCNYKLRIFPTRQFQDEYTTNKPAIYVISLACVILFTLTTLIVYNRIVEKRQKIVMKEAVQSRDIVTSLFPENVCGRLYEINNDEEHQGTKLSKNVTWETKSVEGADRSKPQHIAIRHKHISDYFPNCTVFFGDLVGFTRWSSERSPTDVFTLLGCLYEAFDEIAVERKVYKIETIGDCYVCVTGLPEPQDDHALIMTNFAADSLIKMRQMLHDELQYDLGADTLNLALRVGLHSGPVIAGVLGGQKSRFQLFGDTVNTAARMESNSEPNKIHVSEPTAKLLKSAGKGLWLTARDGMIEAKGKGKMQTYWVNRLQLGYSTRAGFNSVNFSAHDTDTSMRCISTHTMTRSSMSHASMIEESAWGTTGEEEDFIE